MRMVVKTKPKDFDDSVDSQLINHLNLDNPQNFLLHAGAGSGKTRSLVQLLNQIRFQYKDRLINTGRQVAVITYTNAAADEIASRVSRDPLFPVSTIHSFCWNLIKYHNIDIQKWLREFALPERLSDLREQQKTGRKTSKASQNRAREIQRIMRRMQDLSVRPVRFSYNPNGDNYDRDSLSHTEVIMATSFFLETKALFRKIVTNRFPIILIDESQDTNKHVLNALLKASEITKGELTIGLIGDTMQKIYSDGVTNLLEEIPENWVKIKKILNHRSPKRIVAFANQLRKTVDGLEQSVPEGTPSGGLKMFIADGDVACRDETEHAVRARMMELVADPLWLEMKESKTLILEHHLAATRLGFSKMFVSLYKIDRFKTGLINGTLPIVGFFADRVAPIIEANKASHGLRLISLLREYSPPLEQGGDVEAWLSMKRKGVRKLTEMMTATENITFRQVLNVISESQILWIPDVLEPFVGSTPSSLSPTVFDEDLDYPDEKDYIEALSEFLDSEFSQIYGYKSYIRGDSGFGTHQGVKGRQFDRVLVVMDDAQQRGFLFNYGKLLNLGRAVDADQNQEESYARTRRLLYVTATRAMKSLALLAYTSNPLGLKKSLSESGWFEEAEIEIIKPDVEV